MKSSELEGIIFDTIISDEKITKKVVCVYALQRCLTDVVSELVGEITDQISRRCTASVPADSDEVSVDDAHIEERIRDIVNKSPDLKKGIVEK